MRLRNIRKCLQLLLSHRREHVLVGVPELLQQPRDEPHGEGEAARARGRGVRHLAAAAHQPRVQLVVVPGQSQLSIAARGPMRGQYHSITEYYRSSQLNIFTVSVISRSEAAAAWSVTMPASGHTPTDTGLLCRLAAAVPASASARPEVDLRCCNSPCRINRLSGIEHLLFTMNYSLTCAPILPSLQTVTTQ